MTTITFAPNNASTPPFQAQITMDGNPYLLTTRWNLYRSFWYVTVTDQNGTIVCNQPLIGSPSTTNIPLFPGIFKTSTIVYVPSSNNFIVSP